MSGIRRHVILVLDGTKYDLHTSARDLANAERAGYSAADQPMMFSLAVVHQALLRINADNVPRDFEVFVDLIDDFDDLEGDGPDDEQNPTLAKA